MYYINKLFNSNVKSKTKQKAKQSYASKILVTVFKIGAISLGVGTLVWLVLRNKEDITNNTNEIEKSSDDNLNSLPLDFNAINNDKENLFKSQNRREIKKYVQDGKEFKISAYTIFDQSDPSVSSLNDGGFFVVWQSNHQDTSDWGIYGQRYDSEGNVIGSEFLVNTNITGAQIWPSISCLYNGRCIVTWMSLEQDGSSWGVYGQLYNMTGNVIGSEFRVNTNTIDNQGGSVASWLTNNEFIIVWGSVQDGSGFGIYGQRFNSSGYHEDDEFQINTYTLSDQCYPTVTGFSDGGFVALWQSGGQDSDLWGIYGQCYDAIGDIIGGEFKVNTNNIGAQERASVTRLIDGGFVVTWMSGYHQDGDEFGIYRQRYDLVCNPVSGEFQVNTFTNDYQRYPSIAGLSDGGFVVVWQSDIQDFNNTSGIYGQRYSSTGNPRGGEFQINTYTAGSQKSPVVTGLTNGGFVVVWESNGQDGDSWSIYGRISAPTLINSQLNITEGDTVAITSDILFAESMWASDDELKFIIRNIEHAYFDNIDFPGVLLTNVTQQVIMDNKIRFTHDDSETAPSFEVSVRDDDGLETSPRVTQIVFTHINDNIPQIINNQITLSNGDHIIFTTDMLSAIDADVDDDDNFLTFNSRNIGYGRFENINNPGILITSFLQQNVINSQIRFVHDGSANAPSYEVSVSDGELETDYYPANIIFYNIVDTDDDTNGNIIPSEFPYEYLIIGGIVLGVGCVVTTGIVASCICISLYAANKNKQKKADEVELLEKTATSFELGDFLVNYKVDYKDIKVLKHIGTGAEAIVYKAKWNDQIVAYKVFKGINQDDIKGFEKEAQIMLESNHPKIVRLYRICIKQESFGMLMEFMEFGSLKTVLAEKTIELNWQSKWSIAYDVASALKFLHSKKVFHRDIKTDNVLLYEQKGGIHAKLADFGLSKIQKAGDQSATMGIGTFKYMAPEMTMGAGKHSIEKTDIYALGMVYVALANKAEPYSDQHSAMNMPAQVGRGELWQNINQTKCPSMFFNLTDRCRAIEPEKRPNAEKIVEELNGMKEHVMGFNLSNELITEKPKNDYERKVISM